MGAVHARTLRAAGVLLLHEAAAHVLLRAGVLDDAGLVVFGTRVPVLLDSALDARVLEDGLAGGDQGGHGQKCEEPQGLRTNSKYYYSPLACTLPNLTKFRLQRYTRLKI